MSEPEDELFDRVNRHQVAMGEAMTDPAAARSLGAPRDKSEEDVKWACPFCGHVNPHAPKFVHCGWDYAGLYQHYLNAKAELAALAAARLALQQENEHLRKWNENLQGDIDKYRSLLKTTAGVIPLDLPAILRSRQEAEAALIHLRQQFQALVGVAADKADLADRLARAEEK